MAGQRVGGLAWGVLTSCLFLATAVPAMELAKSQPLARDEDKAANLYAQNLGQPVTAARLLRQMRRGPTSTVVAEQAQLALDKLAPTLREVAVQHVRIAATQHGAEALQSLQDAEDADPENLSIGIRRAQVMAEGNDLDGLQHAIQALSRRGAATPTVLAGLPRMGEHLKRASFRGGMTRLLGATRLHELDVLVQQGAKKTALAVGTVGKDCADCPEWVVLPAGSFTMGSNLSEAEDEMPAHGVSVRSMAMGRTEVTRAQWQAVMLTEPPGYFTECGPTCPVESVTWSDVQMFLQKLSLKTGHRYRLPSEAEWEYACQAGEHHTYCGSDNVDEVAWYGNGGASSSGGNSEQRIHPVAQKKANAWGLFDMSGNVWEWVDDCLNMGYLGAPNDGSAWLVGDCSRHMARGGGWPVYESIVRSAVRGNYAVSMPIRSTSLGFRVVRALP
ncbi:SUMF1/EgtB/PvdO family nonheme iron enzyme [Leptothrix ochracea]|uniref:SUMF1/EgtB/PvdO family nonheme iron enzyme n=1 Tax=Leptothrix ochracea TaxID=735331 RepID=UPI0034E275C6